MQLRNHIVYKFLMDKPYQKILLEKFKPNELSKLFDNGIESLSDDEILSIGQLTVIYPQKPKCYYITKSVMSKLDFLKIKNYDWRIFDNIPLGEYVFIFDNNSLLSMLVMDGSINFFYLSALSGNIYKPKYLRFFYTRYNNEISEEFDNQDIIERNKHIYKLLCFFFLSDNSEIIVNSGKSHQTRKHPDSLSNDLNAAVTIVNSNWNITSIRNEGFNVSGHFRMQPFGSKRSDVKMIFIEPFKKNGYVRKAINTQHI